jgi:TonB family protein
MSASPSTMSDLVSSAIAGRLRDEESLRRSLIVSATGHGVGLLLLVFLPGLLGLRSAPSEVVMNVSLDGGAPGAPTGGKTPLSARPVQRAEPKPELPRPEPVRPPAARTPEMVEPLKTTRTPPRTPVTQAPKDASSRTPVSGQQVSKGASNVDTKGAQTNETGLSTGGVAGNANATTGDFCDPQYLGQMISLIHRNWNPNQGVLGTPIVRYIIQRDGTLTDVSLKQTSRFAVLDLNATRAVQLTRAIPPLPSCYPFQTFIVNLSFEYTR